MWVAVAVTTPRPSCRPTLTPAWVPPLCDAYRSCAPRKPTLQPSRYQNEIATAGGRRMVSFGELHQRLLEHYAAPSAVVDDRYDIVHLSDRAGHFLQLGPGEASLNLLKMAPEEWRYDLKLALDQAIETMRTITRSSPGRRNG